MTTARLSLTMSNLKFPRPAGLDVDEPPPRADRFALWLLLALGLLLMLVSVANAEQGTATRTDRFNGTVAAGQRIHLENISGDVVASPGAQFSAVVTLTVSAPTAQKANEILKQTEIVSEHDDEGWSLETVLPEWLSGGAHGGKRRGAGCDQCRVVARYEIVIPRGVSAELQTVNGDVRVKDVDGELELSSVNGSIEVAGGRRGLSLQTVNGHIDAASLALPADAEVSLQSVNGNVALTLPKDAKFDFAASTMNGTIVSTFPLPAKTGRRMVWVGSEPDEGSGTSEAKGKSKSKEPKAQKEHRERVIVEDEDGNRHEVNLDELDDELAESMKEIEISIEQGMRESEKDLRTAERQLRRIEIPNPHREYSGSIGKGGPDVHMETLNGKVVLLAAGTKEADAKPLVSKASSFVVTVPPIHVRVPPVAVVAPPPPPPAPAPRVPPVPPMPPVPDVDGDIVRGDIAGDFLSTSGGDYRIGKVTGRVKILTHSGEIRVASAGSGADLKTFGGDIVIGPITGDLKASTLAGDIVGQSVSGSALADTNGGDIRLERVGGNLDARTSGGDIRVARVGGAVRAASAGGEIRIGVLACDPKGGVSIRNDGGHVSLALPADCKAELELVVTGTDEDENAIRSEFADLVVSKKAGTQRATATLNGGGEKITVRTTSGTIRLKKGTTP